MNLMWFEIKFSDVDLSRGKDTDLINETKKLYRILDQMDGIALYAGKRKKNIGQSYYLTIPDNDVGRNLTQYLKLKKYKPGVEPQQEELNYICGSLSTINVEEDFNTLVSPNHFSQN